MTISIELSDDVLRALATEPAAAAAELRMAAAARLYELGRLSSGAAADLAGVPRVVFLSRLSELGVHALASTEAGLADDLASA